MEKILENQSTTTSTGSGWFNSLVNAAASTGAAYLNRNKTAAAGQPNTNAQTNLSPMLLIGGGILLLVVLVFALKK